MSKQKSLKPPAPMAEQAVAGGSPLKKGKKPKKVYL